LDWRLDGQKHILQADRFLTTSGNHLKINRGGEEDVRSCYWRYYRFRV
jgi:hypothetical protein